MNLENQLATIVNKWNLLNHPFYQAWSAGTLPVEALQVYAREYGAFIKLLPQGWLALQDAETAEEEKEHIELWGDFTEGLGGKFGAPETAETSALVQTAEALFASPASALGALYAFEVQQPETAKSKLHGLKAFYNVPKTAERYFVTHSANWLESKKILAQIYELPPKEREQALIACNQMSEALWNGLTGIYEKTCMKQ